MVSVCAPSHSCGQPQSATRRATTGRKGGMLRNVMALSMASVLLAGCIGTSAPRLDSSGASVKGVYPVTTKNIDAVRERALATVNGQRQAAGLPPVVMDPQLARAADLHSADMSAQSRAWNFGSDGSSPMERASRAGFHGVIVGELVSQTYESEVQTIAEWMKTPSQRAILLSPQAGRIGLGVMQEENMKLWWTLTVAR